MIKTSPFSEQAQIDLSRKVLKAGIQLSLILISKVRSFSKRFLQHFVPALVSTTQNVTAFVQISYLGDLEGLQEQAKEDKKEQMVSLA